MAGSVLWSESAMTDLRYAVEYIAEDSPTRARNFAEGAILKADELDVFPSRGHVVPELGAPYRELPYKNHRIIYRTDEQVVWVVAFVHGARDLIRYWRDR